MLKILGVGGHQGDVELQGVGRDVRVDPTGLSRSDRVRHPRQDAVSAARRGREWQPLVQAVKLLKPTPAGLALSTARDGGSELKLSPGQDGSGIVLLGVQTDQ